MKKVLLTIVLLAMGLTVANCPVIYAQTQWDNGQYAYNDDYQSENWSNLDCDIMYSYYDVDQLFLVVCNGRIFIIPYDYFYSSIYPYQHSRMHWYSYDHFSSLWGMNRYNQIWDGYYMQHNRSNWSSGRNWYSYQKSRNHNQAFSAGTNRLQGNTQYRNRTLGNSTQGSNRLQGNTQYRNRTLGNSTQGSLGHNSSNLQNRTIRGYKGSGSSSSGTARVYNGAGSSTNGTVRRNNRIISSSHGTASGTSGSGQSHSTTTRKKRD